MEMDGEAIVEESKPLLDSAVFGEEVSFSLRLMLPLLAPSYAQGTRVASAHLLFFVSMQTEEDGSNAMLIVSKKKQSLKKKTGAAAHSVPPAIEEKKPGVKMKSRKERKLKQLMVRTSRLFPARLSGGGVRKTLCVCRFQRQEEVGVEVVFLLFQTKHREKEKAEAIRAELKKYPLPSGRNPFA